MNDYAWEYCYRLYIYNYKYIEVDFNDLTGIMLNKGNHPQMALIQVSEILPIYYIIYICVYICVYIYVCMCMYIYMMYDVYIYMMYIYI